MSARRSLAAAVAAFATTFGGARVGAAAATGAATAAPPFDDSIAQRVLACTGCHGREGRVAPGGYQPRIAGKPAGYLSHQLLNFRDGRRAYGPMTTLLDPLGGAAGDAYLREIAAHFASLELPYPPPLPTAADAATLARGEALVRRGDPARHLPACTRCHGEAMTGVAPAIPGLLGLPRDYLNAQLGAWRTGHRRAQAPDCMAVVANALAPDDVAALTAWLAAQPVPPGGKPAAALPAALPLACGGVPGGGVTGGGPEATR